MEYENLFKLPTGVDDIESVFKTKRGSTYAHHLDATTTRNRSGKNHKDPSTGIQPRSGRTIFMDPRDVNKVAGVYQNAEMATRFVPIMEEGKPTGKVGLQLMEDYGSLKAGSMLETVDYSTRPAVGSTPVEIWGSESPMKDTGKNIHFGNVITEVHPKPDRLKGPLSKLGVVASLAAAASNVKAGEYGKAIDNITDIAVPPFMESRSLNKNEDLELKRLRNMPPTISKGPLYKD